MFTYTLPIGFAYCTGVCLTPVRMIGITTENVGADYTVEHGTCPVCTLRVARIYVTGQGTPITSERLAELRDGDVSEWTAQRMGWRAFEGAMVPSHLTYVGGTYVPRSNGYGNRWQDGRDTRVSAGLSPNLTGRMYGWEMLAAIGDSIDVQGQRSDGAARWGDILRVKAASAHFDAVLETLAREGQDLPSVAWDRYGAGQGEWTIGNGHHRLTASLLLGMLTFPLIVSTGNDYMCGEDSMDDDNRPLYADERNVWQVLRNVLPAGDGLAENMRTVHDFCQQCDGGLACGTRCCAHRPNCTRKAQRVAAEASHAAALAAPVVPQGNPWGAPYVAAQGTVTRARGQAAVDGAAAAREAVADLARMASQWGRDCDAKVAELLAEVARVQGEAVKARARAEGYRAVVIG